MIIGIAKLPVLHLLHHYRDEDVRLILTDRIFARKIETTLSVKWGASRIAAISLMNILCSCNWKNAFLHLIISKFRNPCFSSNLKTCVRQKNISLLFFKTVFCSQSARNRHDPGMKRLCCPCRFVEALWVSETWQRFIDSICAFDECQLSFNYHAALVISGFFRRECDL